MSFYIYAETAFHHEGDKSYLLKLVDEAKKSGVDGVKFQVLIALDEFMSSQHSAYPQASAWVLTLDEWKEVFQYTANLELDIILMPLDCLAFELCALFEVKYLEIHSVSFKDNKLLSRLDESTIPLILGVGGRTLSEVEEVVKKYQDREIILMTGFQSFPSEIKDIKLLRIKKLLELYPQCEIGYADHSSFDDEMSVLSNDYAFMLGARVFEKHIALEEGKERIDFQSAVGVEKISKIKNRLSFLDRTLGLEDGKLFEMNKKEIVYRNRQKLPVAKFCLEIGHKVIESDIELKMLDVEETIGDIKLLLGKKLVMAKLKGSPFLIGNFE